jgi:hypothetical protein
MASRLVNVRLDPERLRKADELRARGIRLSDLVRQAIDERYAQAAFALSPSTVTAVVQRIFEQHPDPAGLPARGYDVHDRRAARAAIRRRLKHR